ncbi:hypothetical protein GUJ93_ZPchr0011g28452 [Zizania palustris]|uniref:Endonuclease/exonuclease/phosphatase domain-containing protein n=1 Tax=Zizania palustris TaxID=103762 RepID=A0A8J5WEX4_ZIZPA|nr:hypothetical protein GUJ93_ZPchr0011g28452 [Zizania palustris]
MGRHISWNILSWNVQGLNSPGKHLAVRSLLSDKSYHIFYIQESKLASLDHSIVREFAPKRFDKFAFSPASGASGGIVVGWISSRFTGIVLSSNAFHLTITFTTFVNGHQWILTTVYGPCQEPDKSLFLDWLKNLDLVAQKDWMFLGDFNLFRFPHNRTKRTGSYSYSHKFNDCINTQGLL